MKRDILMLVLLAALTVLVLGTPHSGEVNASEDPAKCSLNTIKGTYVFAAHGVMNDGQNVLPYAEAGIWTLDGKGNAQGVFSASLNGVPIATQEAFTATYQQESGCVFTAFAPVGNEVLAFHLYTTHEGETITYFAPGFSGTQFKR